MSSRMKIKLRVCWNFWTGELVNFSVKVMALKVGLGNSQGIKVRKNAVEDGLGV